jgi:magnesium-transporting ATPase (P-type)
LKETLKKHLQSLSLSSTSLSGSTEIIEKKAIIVAGDSLVLIDGNDGLREDFLELSDHSDVVLACRVSPKQKADIVNMIRKRFPKKVTLAIGDGANDVNMIL